MLLAICLIGPICLIGLIVFLALVNRSYGNHYTLSVASMSELPMVTTLKAHELALVLNTLLDIQQELQRPFFMRFWHYRGEKELLRRQRALAVVYLDRLDTIEGLADSYAIMNKEE